MSCPDAVWSPRRTSALVRSRDRLGTSPQGSRSPLTLCGAGVLDQEPLCSETPDFALRPFQPGLHKHAAQLHFNSAISSANTTLRR